MADDQDCEYKQSVESSQKCIFESLPIMESIKFYS